MTDTALRRIFAENLRFQLYTNNLTQADMARRMHVSTATAAKWCSGQTIPRIDKIQSLCNWFGIEKSDLLEEAHHGSDTRIILSDEEQRLILAYRNLSEVEKDMVCRQLQVRREKESSLTQTEAANG